MRYLTLLLITLMGLPAFAHAQPSLTLPVNCELGSTCWIVNYVDIDESANAKDFKCGKRTYDAHFGTDFGVADLLTAQGGVDVLAAADGTVLRVRDGAEDKLATAEEREQLLAENKGCGNGVFIDHGNGWQTIYCHMKKDSIIVKPDQNVKSGSRLGQIGYSGNAEFPHLHFGVFFEGQPVEPFQGLQTESSCLTENLNPLWSKNTDIGYDPTAIYAAGFTASVPDFDAIKIDISQPAAINSADSPPIVFWAGIYGVNENDRVLMEIVSPSGQIFAQREIKQEKTRARQFYYVGRKTEDKDIESGTYTGRITLTRDAKNRPPITRNKEITIDVR